MRVALLTYSTKPRGGVVHTLALAEAMAARGTDVTVVTLGRGGDTTFFRPVDPRVLLHVVHFAARDGESVGDRIERSIDALRAGFDARGFDIVHAEDCISANAVESPIRTVHHLDSFTTQQLVECHERAIVQPRALVCVSQAVADEVRAGWGRSATVIPNGVDSATFEHAASSEPDALAARHRWRTELGRYVVAVGGIEPRKGAIELVEAFATLAAEHPDVSLVFAGGETLFDYADYRRRFDETAARLGVVPIMLGVVDQARLPALVAEAAAMGFLSTKEGFGLAALEALAASTPVVARELPVLREVFGETVRYGQDVPGFAAQLATALRGEHADPDSGRTLARSYSWEAAAASHLELYERLGPV